MRKLTFLITMCCLLAPAALGAAAPEIDCKSARRPNVDLKTYLDTCDARAASERAGSGRLAVAAATVSQSRTTVAGLNFANVPTWSTADILAQFPLTRDKRYMTATSNPGFQRRISWLYPEDGCFSRAEQVNVQIAQAGKVKPYKLFVFGDLRVYTNNTPSGVVEWGWHTVPVVKTTAGEPIVFDAALSPCKPLPWREWLWMMVDDIGDLDNVAGGWGVSLGDPNAYWTSSLVSGEPSHAAESLTHQTTDFLIREWNRQIELGRDPNVVLGATPPWGGFACVNSEIEQAVAAVAANSSQTVTATCPIGTLAVGGGLGLGTPQGFLVTRNSKSGNGWQVSARNAGSSSANLVANVVCLNGAPAGASVTTVTGSTTNISPLLWNSSNASCASGTMVGGGYSTTGTTSVMRVYNNRRSTNTGSTWQVSAYNTTATTKSVTAYAYCLANTSFTFNQLSTSVQAGGPAFTICSPKKVLGGGFAFPRTSAYNVHAMYPFGSEIYIVDMNPIPSGGDPNALGYAECLAHP